MASYHLSVKKISRAKGRSATGAAAYRSGQKIVDFRTGQVFDYTKKKGVVFTEMIMPHDAPTEFNNREFFWNQAEKSDKRKDACVAREFEIALPRELNDLERTMLAVNFAKLISEKHKVGVDVCIHEPPDSKTENYHAHILISTRRVTANGLGEKTREFDTKNGPQLIKDWRKKWEEMQNSALQKYGKDARVDCRSFKDRGIDEIPQQHLGPIAKAIERKTGQESKIRIDWQQVANERLQKIADENRRETEKLERELDDLIFARDEELMPNDDMVADFQNEWQEFEDNQKAEDDEWQKKLFEKYNVNPKQHEPEIIISGQHDGVWNPPKKKSMPQEKTQEVAAQEVQLYVPDWIIHKEMQNGKNKTRQPNASRTQFNNNGSGLFGLPELSLVGMARGGRSSGSTLVLHDERGSDETPQMVRRENVHASDARAAEPEPRKLTLQEKQIDQYKELLKGADPAYREKVLQYLQQQKQQQPKPPADPPKPKPSGGGGWSGPS